MGRTAKDILEDLAISDHEKVIEAMDPGVLEKEEAEAWSELVTTRGVTNHALGTSINPWARAWLEGSDRSAMSADSAAWEADKNVHCAAEVVAHAAEALDRGDFRLCNNLAARAVIYRADTSDKYGVIALAEEFALQVEDLRAVLARRTVRGDDMIDATRVKEIEERWDKVGPWIRDAAYDISFLVKSLHTAIRERDVARVAVKDLRAQAERLKKLGKRGLVIVHTFNNEAMAEAEQLRARVEELETEIERLEEKEKEMSDVHRLLQPSAE